MPLAGHQQEPSRRTACTLILPTRQPRHQFENVNLSRLIEAQIGKPPRRRDTAVELGVTDVKPRTRPHPNHHSNEVANR